MKISSLVLRVFLAVLLKVISGYDEIIKTNDPEEFRVDSSDGHQYVGSRITRNNRRNGIFTEPEVNDLKESDQKIPDGSDHKIIGKKIEIEKRQITIASQNHDEKDQNIRNCNDKTNDNRHCGGSYVLEPPLDHFEEDKFKLDRNANNESDIGSYLRTKIRKRAVRLSVNNGLWVLSNMLKNKNKMAMMRKPKVVKMKLRRSMLHHLFRRNIWRNNVPLRFWLIKLGR